MKLLQQLSEMHYGSLIDQDKYDSADKADRALYKYTADGFTDISEYVDKLAKRYPFDGGALYRGLHFDTQEQYDSFMEKIKDGEISMGGPSSWTPSESTAEDFARTKKTYFVDLGIMTSHRKMQDEGEHMPGYGGVVIKTHAEAGAGVDVNKSPYAKEREVLLKPGTYKVTVHQLQTPHKRALSSIETVREVLRQAAKSTERDKALDSKLEFIIKSWLMKDKLEEDDADNIMKYELRKFFKQPASVLKDKYSGFEITREIFKEHRMELRLNVYVPIDSRVFDKCSPDMQELVIKKVNTIAKGVEEKIKELVAHADASKIYKFHIDGFDGLRYFAPDAANKAVAPFRKFLAGRYHAMNDRAYTKTIDTSDKMRDHAKDVESVVKAMASL